MIATSRTPAEETRGVDPFIGEITMFGGHFAPRGWAFCDGQLLSISENSALFSLLGTTYGGDGRTTFGLPDLRGRVAIHAGQGPGLTDRRQGSKGGVESVTLTTTQLPHHNHTLNFVNSLAKESSPAGHAPAIPSGEGPMLFGSLGGAETGEFHEATIGFTGGSQAHENMPPYGTVRYIIALQGVYPSRN
ncbi:MAG: phage tail protein [Phycisphaera sp.]|nr:MAG: phage tail protein [Phycisphaera sp.]